ncbi:MAG: hypothetical protein K8R18_12285 [Parvibaculum sp.]|uniref:hypothetical protein n=1 Tax=Parvibaculum sp. TaxID=2024848 RepID=UPI0025D67E1F|nr:hypothetical protein [Parvibaculum sp.]MCE9650392.1 hypothetical protein [Parvibaculum sp.]
MEDRQSTAQKAEPQTRRVEPIFDASGTLRRIPEHDTKTDADDDLSPGRQYGHPAR